MIHEAMETHPEILIGEHNPGFHKKSITDIGMYQMEKAIKVAKAELHTTSRFFFTLYVYLHEKSCKSKKLSPPYYISFKKLNYRWA